MADVAESQENAPAERAELTVPEMRQWLRNWVGKAVGKAPDSIDESVPMVELGLSSRDAVAMAADIEDLTGVTLSVAVAFAHPTIESLATRIIEGEPETDLAGDDAEDWSRTGPAERVDIAIVGLSTRFPGEMNTPEQTWQALLERPRRDHRPARRALVGIPRRAAAGRAGRRGPHPGRLPEGHQGLRFGVLRGGQDRSRQHRPAAADGAGADLGGARARPHPGVEPARPGRRCVHRQLHQRLQLPGGVGPDGRAPVCDHRHQQLDHRQPGVLLLRLPRTVGHH